MKRRKQLLLGGSLCVLAVAAGFVAFADSDSNFVETISSEEPDLLYSSAALVPQTGMSSSATPRTSTSTAIDPDVLEVSLDEAAPSSTGQDPSPDVESDPAGEVQTSTATDQAKTGQAGTDQTEPNQTESEEATRPEQTAGPTPSTAPSAPTSRPEPAVPATDTASDGRPAEETPSTSVPTTTTNPPTTSTTSPGSPGRASVGSGGPVQYTYETETGDTGTFYSDRDCGWSTPVSGVDGQGRSVSRALWAFCDSVGYVPESGSLWSEFGVLSSSYGLAKIGANPTVDSVISPTRSDGAGNPLLLHELMSRPEETCTAGSATPYPREWARGMVTLPDSDPTIETVVVFYQNFCIDFREAVEFGAGGVAIVQWDANNPDGELRREKLNDRWFLPGQTTDERTAALYPSFSYGSGPILATEGGTTFVYSYLCGAGGDCSVARVSIDPANSSSSARRLADTANWRYLSVDGNWASFPSAEAWGTCAPTTERNCGGYPAPRVVVDADRSDILTTAAAEPSFKQARGKWYMLYSAGLDDGRLAYRVADNPAGPFSEPRLVRLGPGHCTKDCRAAFWQPSADRDGLWAISYYDEHGLDGLVNQGNADRRGRLMVTYVNPAEFR